VIDIGRQVGIRMKKRLSAATAALVAGVLFALPAPAGAAETTCSGPTGDQYCDNTQVLTASGAGSSDSTEPAGGLPFTGLDLGLSVAAGAALLGAGVALRRVSRGSSS
jgi:hypothetical protein